MSPSKLEASSDNTVWQACLLAVVAGYADAVGFLVFNAFAGAMTGNTVLLGIALASQQFAAAAQSAGIIAAFVVGVAASALLRRYVPLAALLGFEAAVIVVAALVMPLVAAAVLAFAMGLQNAAMTHFAGTSLNTVFLTGNLQKLVETLLRRDAQPARATSEGPLSPCSAGCGWPTSPAWCWERRPGPGRHIRCCSRSCRCWRCCCAGRHGAASPEEGRRRF